MSSQQFSLRWNNYINHITGAFDSLRSDEDLVDVTLSCEGKRIRAHKMLLSACSTYFKDLFKENPCPHPVIIFRNVKFEDLVALIDFMYQGEVNVVQDQLASFLTTAELLAVQGLSEGGYKGADICEEPSSPALPPEPEIQMSSSSQVHSQQESCSSSASVASPMSYLALDHEPESPCAKRRKKSSSSTVKSNSTGDVKSSERESNTERNFISNKSNGDSNSVPPEIMPVIPNLKVEMPEYVQRELQSCDYGDANQSISNMTGGQDIKTDGLSLSHNVQSRESKDNTEPPDMFCLNSRDSSIPLPSESLSTSDVGQVLSKPGTSGERQVQDSLQDYTFFPSGKTCPICKKTLSQSTSMKRHILSTHVAGNLESCTVCGKIFKNKYNMWVHRSRIHHRQQSS